MNRWAGESDTGARNEPGQRELPGSCGTCGGRFGECHQRATCGDRAAAVVTIGEEAGGITQRGHAKGGRCRRERCEGEVVETKFAFDLRNEKQ
jgi:hypothetical protein